MDTILFKHSAATAKRLANSLIRLWASNLSLRFCYTTIITRPLLILLGRMYIGIVKRGIGGILFFKTCIFSTKTLTAKH